MIAAVGRGALAGCRHLGTARHQQRPRVLGGGDWFARFLEPSFSAAGIDAAAGIGATAESGSLEGALMVVSSPA